MANKIYSGNAATTAQVVTYTPANVNIGNTFTISCNGKDVTFTATAATVANVVTGLYDLMTSGTSPPPAEFQEVDWKDDTTMLIATSNLAGRPFDFTTGATGGTAQLNDALIVANSGPSDISVGDNWVGGTVPSSSDVMYFEDSDNDILYGLDFSSMSNAGIVVADNFSGNFGLPAQNPNGYYEYRDTYLRCGATAFTFSGTGGRAKFDMGSSNLTATIYNTGTSADIGLPAMLLKTSGTLSITVNGESSVGLGVYAGETLGTVTATQNGGELILGTPSSTHSVTSLVMNGGSATTAGAATGIVMYDGDLTHYSGTISSLTVYDGEAVILGGAITTMIISGSIDFSQSMATKTVQAATAMSGATINDPAARVTWTTGITLSRARYADVNIDIGRNRLIGIT